MGWEEALWAGPAGGGDRVPQSEGKAYPQGKKGKRLNGAMQVC